MKTPSRVWLAAALACQSPVDLQVVQRGTTPSARLPVRCEFPQGTSRVDLRIYRPDGALERTERHAVSTEIGTTVGTVLQPRVNVEVDAVDARGTVLATHRAERVGAGEVFLTAGQSNSTASGSEMQHAASDFAVNLDPFSGRFVKYDDETIHPGGGTPWPTFASELSAQLAGVPVAVIEAGCGGTFSAQWQPAAALVYWGDRVFCARPDEAVPTSNLFEKLVETGRRVKQISGGFRAVLWHQGESDSLSNVSQRDYERNMVTLIDKSAARWAAFGIARPTWIAARTTAPQGNRRQRDRIRAAQTNLARRGVVRAGPDTDVLGPEFRAPDGIHFNGPGLRAHGAMWVQPVLGQMPYRIPPTMRSR